MFAAGKTNAVSGQLYVDDVFSTYLYTGTNAAQTITNEIDLSTYGGLVWRKGRTGTYATDDHVLVDTARGRLNSLFTDTTSAQIASFSRELTSFNSNGFTMPAGGTNGYPLNNPGTTYVSWTFREAPKFFDVVTYTGDGAANRAISHSLGSVPGMVIVKWTNSTSDWAVWHRSFARDEIIFLNATNAKGTGTTAWGTSANTATTFNVGIDGNGYTNWNGGTYVAYLFAHDTATDGIIQCGSFTTVSNNADVTLGWEPQFVLVKKSSAGSDWILLDNMRGMGVNTSGEMALSANSSAAESENNIVRINATGFKSVQSDGTYIYLAIRRPNKPPTTGTQVFTNSLANPSVSVNVGFVPDMAITKQRDNGVGGSSNSYTGSRLIGNAYALSMNNTNAEGAFGWGWDQSTNTWIQSSVGTPVVDWLFRRAPGVFDEVCYTGTGVAHNEPHNLGVAPELAIVKMRNYSGSEWYVYCSLLPPNSGNGQLLLNRTDAAVTSNGMFSAVPTASSLPLPAGGNLNQTIGAPVATYVAYLFATSPGISKVFSYTGNGSSQTINCGFSTGARFVLIKRTDSTGDWYVWDSARGIVAGNDPHLSLNTTAAEVTTDDSVDTDSTGFVVNQLAATNVNVTSATYIGLAFA